jgi:hypothetical protein
MKPDSKSPGRLNRSSRRVRESGALREVHVTRSGRDRKSDRPEEPSSCSHSIRHNGQERKKAGSIGLAGNGAR